MRFQLVALACVMCVNVAHAQRGAVLVPLPSIHITDVASSPLTRPRGLQTDPDGGFYVADNATSVVARFTATGTPVRRYGARGDGPGEMRTPTHVSVINDTLLVIGDARRRELNFFQRNTGRFISRVPVPGMPGSIHSRANDVWIGAMNVATRLAVAHVALPGANVDASVALPEAYTDGSPVSITFYEVHALPTATGIVVGFGATNYLVAINAGRAADTLVIPVRARRGVPPKLDERVKQMNNAQEFYELMSSLIALERVSPTVLLAAHTDLTMRAGGTFAASPGAPDPFTHKLFVSLVNVERRTACADIAVPISGDQAPSVAVRGDTLFVLDQDPNADQPWIVRRFAIRESECMWQAAR